MKLTLNEIAQCLGLTPSTVRRWIRQGRIPAGRSGEGFSFERTDVEKWAAAHNLPFSVPQEFAERSGEPEPERLVPAMERGGVFHDTQGSDVGAVLESAVNRMSFLNEDGRQQVYAGLMEREGLASTGIGKGVAIPHPRNPLSHVAEPPVICTCFLEKPVDFHTVDNQPVFVMFILLSPNTRTHLHLLSRLAFCLRNDAFVAFLKTQPDPGAFFEKMTDLETQLDMAAA